MKKENYSGKLNALRKLFADIVEKNFYARCQYVQLMFNPDKGEFVRLVNEFNPPPMPPNSVQFPLVARGLDFKCLQDFTFTHHDKIGSQHCDYGCPLCCRLR